jgi:uncharacterized membrane protein
MLTLAGLIWLPLWAIILFGVALVAGHNALDGITANSLGEFAPLWSILHAPGILINTGRSVVVVSYVLTVLVIMFPLCRWYAQVKRTRDYWWLSYL